MSAHSVTEAGSLRSAAFPARIPALFSGFAPAEAASTGVDHPAVVVVACVLVLLPVQMRRGAAPPITRTRVDAARSLGAQIAITCGTGSVLSAVMTDVAALALLLPVATAIARRPGREPGQSRTPLSATSFPGGMVSLTGTARDIISTHRLAPV